jgi:hypothetical protein
VGRGLGAVVGCAAVVGACRVEYARDLTAGTGTVHVNWGEVLSSGPWLISVPQSGLVTGFPVTKCEPVGF